jgi:hypothetical protein
MRLKSNPLVRVVSGDKTVKGKLLNPCGAQVVRTVTARTI